MLNRLDNECIVLLKGRPNRKTSQILINNEINRKFSQK